MDALGRTALVSIGVWLGVLTVVVVLVVRQIALIMVRLATTDGATFLDNDGPALDTAVPPDVVSALPTLAWGRSQLLLLSGTCRPCRELAAALGRHQLPSTVALVTGTHDLAEGLVALLPQGMRVLRDPEASGIARALHIHSTPFAVVVEDGSVRRKTYVRKLEDLLQLVEGEQVPAPTADALMRGR